MKKILLSLLVVFFAVSNAKAGLSFLNKLDMRTPVDLTYDDLSAFSRLYSFDNRDDGFTQFLIERGFYDDQNNVISISAYNLAMACHEFIGGDTVACASATYSVIGDALARARYNQTNVGNPYDIFEIYVRAQNIDDLKLNFMGELGRYIVNKYCVDVSNSQISCEPERRLACKKTEHTQYLLRDLDLMCNSRNWVIGYNTRTKTYGAYLNPARAARSIAKGI